MGDSIAAICGNYNLALEVSFLFSTCLVKKPLRVDAFPFFAVPAHSEVSGGAYCLLSGIHNVHLNYLWKQMISIVENNQEKS